MDNKYIRYLNKIYNHNGCDAIVFYGSYRSGVYSIINEFLDDKPCFKYTAKEVDLSLQLRLFEHEFYSQTKTPIYVQNDYGRLFLSYLDNPSPEKKIIVFYNFEFICRNDSTFLNMLISFISEHNIAQNILIVLCSNNVKWIENDLINIAGKKVLELSAMLKVDSILFPELCNIYTDCDTKSLFEYYCVLGGNIKLWNNMNSNISIKDYIINRILSSYNELIYEINNILPSDIRAKAVYNTILYYLSNGYTKLNDLHSVTGISRSKLSVYLNILIENDIVIKLNSCEYGNISNTVKGVYKIKDPFTAFCYRFIFGNISISETINPEKFYRKNIEPGIDRYILEYFDVYCMSMLEVMNQKHKLPFIIHNIEIYLDKNKYIDFIINTIDGLVLICACYTGQHPVNTEYYDTIKKILKSNAIIYDKICIFSVNGFDSKYSIYSNDVIMFDTFDLNII